MPESKRIRTDAGMLTPAQLRAARAIDTTRREVLIGSVATAVASALPIAIPVTEASPGSMDLAWLEEIELNAIKSAWGAARGPAETKSDVFGWLEQLKHGADCVVECGGRKGEAGKGVAACQSGSRPGESTTISTIAMTSS